MRRDEVSRMYRVFWRVVPFLATTLMATHEHRTLGTERPEEPAAEVDGFRMSASGRQLDLSNGEAVTLTSVLSRAAEERLVIKDSKGTVVRTLVNEARRPGTYRDAWDGFGDRQQRLPDGQYLWVASFGEGSRKTEIDRTSERDGDAEVMSHPEYSKWNPFANQPLVVRHRFEKPGEITLVFSRETYYVRLGCDPPKFCRFLEGFHPAGDFEYRWAGVDESGALRDDVRAIFVVSSHERLARNGIVVFRGRPAVTDVRVTPTPFRPGMAKQEVDFSVRSFRNEMVSATVTFTNQESRSVLRTLRISDLAPGTGKVVWDGRSENGAFVAPGGYTIRVVVTNALGQSASAEILTQVDY